MDIIKKINTKNQITNIPSLLVSFYLNLDQENKVKVLIAESQSKAEDIYRNTKNINNSKKIFLFPEWDNLNDINISPSVSVQTSRILTIYKAIKEESICIITTKKALEQKIPPLKYIEENSFKIKLGSSINLENISIRLINSGYERSDIVQDRGFFSIRGNILDIFCPIYKDPLRIELFGDTVEEIKFYKKENQKSFSSIKNCEIIPVRELSINKNSKTLFKKEFKTYCDNLSINKKKRNEIIELVDNNIYFPGIENYLYFFHEKLSLLTNVLEKNSLYIYYDKHLFDQEKEEEHISKDIISSNYLIDKNILIKNKKYFFSIPFQTELEDSLEISSKTYDFSNSKDLRKDLEKHFFKNKNKNLIYAASTISQAKRIKLLISSFIKNIDIEHKKTLIDLVLEKPPKPQILISKIKEGLTTNELSVLTEKEIFGKIKQDVSKSKKENLFLNIFKELKQEDYVVHTKHGIGKYKGLKKINIDDTETDFFEIEYAKKDILFVPVYRLDSVQKYIANKNSNIKIDTLGSERWSKKKSKIKKEAKDIAYKLLKQQALRAKKKGYSFSSNNEDYIKFESEFEFEETLDQTKAIKAVTEDMEKAKPMDRLVCGDVGFGKTEIALRASFKAVNDGKQVALLAPTTVLSFQHYQTFKKRFKNYPVEIEFLNRFKTKSEQNKIIKKLKNNQIDILIGTHRILSDDVNFNDLGLLIIDEEQRFGVTHKEKIKEISSNIDVLILTATPIPRTLNLSLVGLKDLSIISTPPISRKPIKTFVSKFNPVVIKKAIDFELKRNGQVFFLHNKVRELKEIETKIKKIYPKAKITVAHGQLKEKELEERILDFYEKKTDILLCTSIIESGLDIPNTNTIIINRSDTLGLSQLYQIRGRVGRSPRQAYCYLLIPNSFSINKIAMERIKTLQKFTELGSGFNIASYDLELRGAGELLGSTQSGFIDDIGLEEYLKLLEESINEIKQEKKERPISNIQIQTKKSSYIPTRYIKNTNQRLYFYKKLSNAKNDELFEIEEELKDQYGPLPMEVENLINLIKIKQILSPIKIENIKIGNNKFVCKLTDETHIFTEQIVNLINKSPKKYKLRPDMKLITNINDNSLTNVIKEVTKLSDYLKGG
jgi:transcription-repair coupling factor (superfamily II helicase)